MPTKPLGAGAAAFRFESLMATIGALKNTLPPPAPPEPPMVESCTMMAAPAVRLMLPPPLGLAPEFALSMWALISLRDLLALISMLAAFWPPPWAGGTAPKKFPPCWTGLV